MLRPGKAGIDDGVEKMLAFIKIHRGTKVESQLAAVENFAAGAGLDPMDYEHLVDRLRKIVNEGGELGWATLGVVIGLYVADHAYEIENANADS